MKKVQKSSKGLKDSEWYILWNSINNFYSVMNSKKWKEYSKDSNYVLIKKFKNVSNALEYSENVISVHKLLTPLVIAKNTIVRDTMTLEEKKIADEVTSNWINWIYKNCKGL